MAHRRDTAPPAAQPAATATRWDALGWVARHERNVRYALDVAGLGIIALTFAGLGHPDLNFHFVWVLLALHAFLFGLRSTMVRIAAATAALVLFYLAGELKVIDRELDLIEWPLMFLISVLVAVMAEWRNEAGRHYAALYRTASDRLLSAHEIERRRLAMDLHDGVGQTLTALSLSLEAIAAARPRARPKLVAKARDMLAGAIAEMRDVAERLQPVRMAAVGLPSAVRHLAERVGIPVDVDVQPGFEGARHLDPDTAVHAFRIVQEALNNAVRHGRPERIRVSMSGHGRWLELSIADDGCGFRPGTIAQGLGMPGMQERAAMIRGELRITASPGHGAIVRLLVPAPREPLDRDERARQIESEQSVRELAG